METVSKTPEQSLTTSRKEVGQVWVMQAKRNKGAPGEGTEGHSVLGVMIEDVSYLGFRITNDTSDEAADYRLFCTDECGVLHAKGLVWKITAKVDKKSERPVTTLYIRIDVTEPKMEARSVNSQSQITNDYLYYVATQKKAVTRAIPGKGMLSSKQPAFGIYQRYFIVDQGNDGENSLQMAPNMPVSNRLGNADAPAGNHMDVVNETEESNQLPKVAVSWNPQSQKCMTLNPEKVGSSVLMKIISEYS